MTIPYDLFLKHAARVTKNVQVNSPSRPILAGIKHLENGDAVVTDSHRLYVAKGIHDRQDGAVITPGGKLINGNYPDVSRLIPDKYYAKQEFSVDAQELLTAADLAATASGLGESKHLFGLVRNEAIFNSADVNMKYSLSNDFEPVWCNAIYLLDALKLFKAAGRNLITYRFYGSMRPFTLSNDDDSLLALILPVRKY